MQIDPEKSRPRHLDGKRQTKVLRNPRPPLLPIMPHIASDSISAGFRTLWPGQFPVTPSFVPNCRSCSERSVIRRAQLLRASELSSEHSQFYLIADAVVSVSIEARLLRSDVVHSKP